MVDVDELVLLPRLLFWLLCAAAPSNPRADSQCTHSASPVQDLTLSEGNIEVNKKHTSLTLTSPFGAITLYGTASKGHLFVSCCGMNPALAARHFAFYASVMAALPVEQCAYPIPGLARPVVPSEIATNFQMLPGEEVITSLELENMFRIQAFKGLPPLDAFSCGSAMAMVKIVRAISCGFRPVETRTAAVITTHRVLACVEYANGCKTTCIPGFKMLYFAPVRQLTGLKITGDVIVNENFFTRNFNALPCCPTVTAYSTTAIGVGATFPVSVPASDLNSTKTGGMLDAPALQHFRRMVSLVLAQNPEHKDFEAGPGSPYFFESPVSPRAAARSVTGAASPVKFGAEPSRDISMSNPLHGKM